MKPPSSLWVSDYSGSSMRMIISGGSEPTALRFPKDLAFDRDGNTIVVDAGLIKTFCPFREPRSQNLKRGACLPLLTVCSHIFLGLPYVTVSLCMEVR